MFRARAATPIVAALLLSGYALTAVPRPVDAASCVRISGGRFDAPGNDN